LKDIFDSCKKPPEIKKKIYETILFNKRFPRSREVSKKILKEGEEEEKSAKRVLLIDFDLEKFFKDYNASDCINKLQKEDLNDSELFFKVPLDKLMEILDIKAEGKKHKVEKKITELREKLEKEGSISYIDLGLLEEGAGLSLKSVKSHIIQGD